MELLERTDEPQEVLAAQTLTEEPAAGSDSVTENVVTKESLLEELREICAQPDDDINVDEVTRIKQQFYSRHNDDVRRLKEEFVAAGNQEEAFTAPEDPAEKEFKALLSEAKEKKAALRARQEAERMANYERKMAIIDELRTMSTDTDNVNRHYPRAKELQAQFKEIGEVLPTQQTEVWKAFQDAVECFYDQWKVNKELRDYDFKKNLAEKQLIISEAEKIVDEPDVITAFKRLQSLHDKWREVGPVAKDLREEIWAKFKDISAVINKRYQAYFEERKQREQENEQAKTALCERLEAMDFTAPATYAAWNDMTKEIMAVQEEWKKLGFASRKMNNALFARFRAQCDDFFARKAEFFKSMKDEHTRNLAAKTEICERAEALKESTDWKKTTDELVELQKRWKAIGAVPKKYSDAVWHRFLEACDYFFDRKKKALNGTRREEQANLKTKQQIVAELTTLNAPDCAVERSEAIARIQQLRQQWQATGHVPFKEKDKLSDAYRKVVGELYDKYDVHENRARMSSFEANIENLAQDENKIYRERERLLRIYEQRRSELQTYENNLGFFNSKTSSGDKMVQEMVRKIQRIKDDIADLEKKIEIIDSKL